MSMAPPLPLNLTNPRWKKTPGLFFAHKINFSLGSFSISVAFTALLCATKNRLWNTTRAAGFGVLRIREMET